MSAEGSSSRRKRPPHKRSAGDYYDDGGGSFGRDELSLARQTRRRLLPAVSPSPSWSFSASSASLSRSRETSASAAAAATIPIGVRSEVLHLKASLREAEARADFYEKMYREERNQRLEVELRLEVSAEDFRADGHAGVVDAAATDTAYASPCAWASAATAGRSQIDDRNGTDGEDFLAGLSRRVGAVAASAARPTEVSNRASALAAAVGRGHINDFDGDNEQGCTSGVYDVETEDEGEERGEQVARGSKKAESTYDRRGLAFAKDDEGTRKAGNGKRGPPLSSDIGADHSSTTQAAEAKYQEQWMGHHKVPKATNVSPRALVASASAAQRGRIYGCNDKDDEEFRAVGRRHADNAAAAATKSIDVSPHISTAAGPTCVYGQKDNANGEGFKSGVYDGETEDDGEDKGEQQVARGSKKVEDTYDRSDDTSLASAKDDEGTSKPDDGNGGLLLSSDTGVGGSNTNQAARAKYKERWMGNYKALKAHKDRFGHINPSRTTHLKLYDWAYRQRKRYWYWKMGKVNKLGSFMTVRQAELLRSIGFDFEVGPGAKDSTHASAEKRASIAHGSKKSESEPDTGYASADGTDSSLSSAKDGRGIGKPSDGERESSPSQTGDDQRCKKENPSKEMQHEEQWAEKYRQLRAYKREFGDKNPTRKTNKKLYHWMYWQRKRYWIWKTGRRLEKNSPMTETQANLLRAIGFDFGSGPGGKCVKGAQLKRPE